MGTESLTDFELLVMLAALRLGPKEAEPTNIALDIESRTGRSVRRARVYRSLSRLREKGFVALLDDSREGRGPPRVKVELEGVAAVRATTEGILAMIGDLNLPDSE